MTNHETIVEAMKQSGQKENIIKALKWIGQESNANSQQEAEQYFVEKCTNGFEKIIKHHNGSYMISDKNDAVQCIICLVCNTSAMSNYISNEVM